MQPLISSSDGYASLEVLSKFLKPSEPTMSQMCINSDAAMNSNLPPISGYVTQKELSAFGQQQKFNWFSALIEQEISLLYKVICCLLRDRNYKQMKPLPMWIWN